MTTGTGRRWRSCVIFCDVDMAMAWYWNKARERGAYPDDVFLELARNPELPNREKYWDSPVCVVCASSVVCPWIVAPLLGSSR